MDTSSTQTSPPGRRGFLRWLTAGLGAVAAAAVSVPFVGYLFSSRKPPAAWVDVGAIGDFPSQQTRMVTFDNPIRVPWDGIVAHTGVFVRREDKDDREQDRFLVLAINCAHLGCPVSWFPQSGLFMCPCHGGVYYATGARASGPPPRGLYRCEWRLREGRLEVQAPHYPTLQDPLKKDDQESA